jgi:hypothetical protein
MIDEEEPAGRIVFPERKQVAFLDQAVFEGEMDDLAARSQS